MYACRMPGYVYAGGHSLEQLSELCKGHRTVALFTDKGVYESGTLTPVLRILQETGIQCEIIKEIPPEPTCDQAQEIAEKYRRLNADLILAVGGGSVMDIAKLCSVLGRKTVRELLQDASGLQKGVFSIMIPTTAGTGAEATPNAIVAVPEKELKVGIVTAEMIPDAVILDGQMLRTLPAKVAASTGVDALCHAVECFTSLKATPFSNMFALEALKLIFRNIEEACLNPEALDCKDAMLLGAFYAGVAIACSGTTAVHALSYPLGGKYHIPHGVANAMMLIPIMKYNLSECVDHFSIIYDALGEKELTEKNDKAEWILHRMDEIVRRLEIPRNLKQYGVKLEDLDGLVAAGMDVKRLINNNRRTVTEDAAREIYADLLK